MTDTKFKSVTSQSSSQTGTLEEIQHLISCNIHWCGDDDPGDDDPAPALDTDKKLALSNIKSILDANHTIENNINKTSPLKDIGIHTIAVERNAECRNRRENTIIFRYCEKHNEENFVPENVNALQDFEVSTFRHLETTKGTPSNEESFLPENINALQDFEASTFRHLETTKGTPSNEESFLPENINALQDFEASTFRHLETTKGTPSNDELLSLIFFQQSKSGQTISDHSESDQSKSDHLESDQSKSDHLESDQSKSDHSEPDQSKSNHLEPDQPEPAQPDPDDLQLAPSKPSSSSPPIELQPDRSQSLPKWYIVIIEAQELHKAMYYSAMERILVEFLASLPKCSPITAEESSQVYFGIGLAFFKQKKYDFALEHFRESVHKLDHRTDDLSVMNASLHYFYMGEVVSSQGSFIAAVDYYRESLKLHREMHDDFHANSLDNPSQKKPSFNLKVNYELSDDEVSLSAKFAQLALALRSTDCLVESERMYREAAICSASGANKISAHIGIGNLLHSIGENDRAVKEFHIAIEVCVKLETQDPLSLAWAHGNLGNTYLSLGKKEEALNHLKISLDLTSEHDFDPSSISRALNNLGTAYQSLDELSEAEKYFDQSLSQAIFAGDHLGQARAYGNIGNLYMLRKEFDKAIPHYTEVLRLSRDRSTVYVAYHNRGCALFELAEKKKGEQYQFTKRGEFQFIAIGPDTGDMDYKHQMEELLSDTLELFKQALKDLKKVINNLESTFSGGANSSTAAHSFYLSLFHINAKTFQKAQDCAFNLRDHYLSLTIAEQARARTLGELLLKRKSHQLPTTFSTPLNIDSIKLAVELLPDPYTPVVVLSYTGTRLLVWVLVFDGKTVSVNSFEQEPDEGLFGKSLDLYLRYDLADALTDNIDLYGEEKSKEETEERSVGAEMDLHRNIPVDGTQCKRSAIRSILVPKKQKILLSLEKMICKPLKAILKAVIPEPILHSRGPHKLILIPDNSTKMIPFNALLNEEGGAYFGDKHMLQFFPSLLCLGVMSQAPPTTIHVTDDTSDDVLIVGDPSTPAFKFEGQDWTPGPLPHAKKEAQWVGHYMRSPPLLGSEPTKEIVISRLKQAKLIHLATHGSATHGFVLLAGHCYNTQSTLRSHRYIEDEKKLLLCATEIESLRLQSCLVILSSCDSGRGKFKGDEIQGMARAFLLAGAAAVMTSLWKVPDQSASYFMQYFYRYLLDGHASSVALQKSIQSVRSIHHFSQVIHWGGYQLTGSDVRVAVEVSKRDEIVWKALGCPEGPSPFPRLELLLQLEKNLLSNVEKNVQLIYGHCGTDPIETVKDFVAKHHDAYHNVLWFNSNHHCVVNEFLKVMPKDCEDFSCDLIIIDDATGKHLPCLTSFPSVNLILIAQSHSEYLEMDKKVDTILKRGVNKLETIKPLTDLESTQRIVYSLISNEALSFIPGDSDTKIICDLSSFCSGSPPVVNFMKQAIITKLEQEENVCDFHENLSQDYDPSNIWSVQLTKQVSKVVDSLNLSIGSRVFLNCLAGFHKAPIPKTLLTALENVIIQMSPTNSSTLSYTDELMNCNCLVYYPSPVVVQSSIRSSFNTALYTVPDIISECVWRKMKKFDRLVSTALSCRTIKMKGLELGHYNDGILSQLKANYDQIYYHVGDSDSNRETSSISTCSSGYHSISSSSDGFGKSAEEIELFEQMKGTLYGYFSCGSTISTTPTCSSDEKSAEDKLLSEQMKDKCHTELDSLYVLFSS